MALPTSRELELEALLRQRDTQLSELNDEVTHLRQYLSSQPGPSTTTSLSLPPAISSILLSNVSVGQAGTTSLGSSTVVAALTQRARLLQEENDELYELLRHGETGKLKEEVRGLGRLVQRLQGALRQSHESINILSRELDKSYESFISVAQPASNPQTSPRTYPSSPPNNNYPPPSGNGNHALKPPPTGPRKRPRLSEPNSVSFNQSHPNKSHNTTNHNHYGHNAIKRGIDGHPKRGERDARGGGDANKGNRSSKMDVDSERPSPPEPGRGRDKDTDREYERDREKERNRERDRDRGPKEQDHSRDRDRGPNNNPNNRRNGNGPGRPSGRRGDRAGGGPGGAPHMSAAPFHGAGNTASNNSYSINGDRTLAERMGL